MKDNIMPLPYKEPSQTLIQLLNQIIDEGRRFAAAGDLKVSDMSANSPVGTTLAILERTLKVMSAVQARVHYSLKQELCLLRDIIRDYTPEEYSYEPQEGGRFAKRSDYDNVDVIPVSDPNAATMSQKVVQYQAVLQLAQQAPQLYNMALLHRQMLDVLGIKNAKKLIPLEDRLRHVIADKRTIVSIIDVISFLEFYHYSDKEVIKKKNNDKSFVSSYQGPIGVSLLECLFNECIYYIRMIYKIHICIHKITIVIHTILFFFSYSYYRN
jgi:hypothetical protein